MDKISDITGRIADNQNRAKYLRLAGILEAQMKDVEANPWPALDGLGAESVRLRGLLEDIRNALNPVIEMMDDSMPLTAYDHRSDDRAKISAIRSILDRL